MCRRNSSKINTQEPKTQECTISRVDSMSASMNEILDKLIDKYCAELDTEMKNLHFLLEDTQKNMTNETLENYIMCLANTLYFTGEAQEDLGIKEDMCKAIRQEVYINARLQSDGKTVADRTAQAELIAQQETITLALYSRAYKKVKLKMEAGYEMLNSLKKIMNKRIAEMELSNSRYINHSEESSGI